MDGPTERLVALLHERDTLRGALQANSQALRPALDEWAATRPGAVRGTATEPGARFLLGQAGVL